MGPAPGHDQIAVLRKLLPDLMGRRPPRAPHANRTTKRLTNELSAELLAELRRLNAYDIRLYDAARLLFAERLAQCGLYAAA